MVSKSYTSPTTVTAHPYQQLTLYFIYRSNVIPDADTSVSKLNVNYVFNTNKK